MLLYNYNASVVKVLDGDTAELVIDLGFKIQWKLTCRFYGINTPELHAKDEAVRAKAIAAKRVVESYLPVGSQVLIKSQMLDKYGRPLVDIYLNNGTHLNQWLIDNGHAISYLP